MIRFKYFFLLVIWVGSLGGVANVSAQIGTDVLVSAGGQTLRQSEVDQLIKFYEWALGTEFTAPQRKRYRELKEEEFRNDPVQAKKGVGELGGYLSQILVKSEGEQAKMRDAFNAGFIPDLRKATDDAEAQFLLNIYDDAKRKAASGEADPADDPGPGAFRISSENGSGQTRAALAGTAPPVHMRAGTVPDLPTSFRRVVASSTRV